jgi:hypothetical protein
MPSTSEATFNAKSASSASRRYLAGGLDWKARAAIRSTCIQLLTGAYGPTTSSNSCIGALWTKSNDAQKGARRSAKERSKCTDSAQDGQPPSLMAPPPRDRLSSAPAVLGRGDEPVVPRPGSMAGKRRGASPSRGESPGPAGFLSRSAARSGFEDARSRPDADCQFTLRSRMSSRGLVIGSAAFLAGAPRGRRRFLDCASLRSE